MSMLTHFYDIESTENVFTLANFMPEGPHEDVYYLVDDPMLLSDPNFYQNLVNTIYKRNPNFRGTVALYDLRTEAANRRLAQEFGLSDAVYCNNPTKPSTYAPEFRLVCDTDPGYSNEQYPYLMGYNSYNYDTTMLAMYLYTVFPVIPMQSDVNRKIMVFRPTTAKQMRVYNDQLFSKRFKKNMPERLTVTFDGHSSTGNFMWSRPNYNSSLYLIRKNMLMSGRHVDVARLNEKAEKVGLKRLIGMLGGQILESDKLKPGQNRIDTIEQLYELIAYNTSDVVNLKAYVFDHDVYQGNFSLKKGLLQTYPELVYDRRDQSEYSPIVDQYHVRRDRLFIDSSSAQLATKALCPYDHLTDIPIVDFLYPAKKKAEEKGIPQVDILEQTRAFFEKLFPQPELRQEFYRIYNFYATHVRGHNFNESKNYQRDYAGQQVPPAKSSDDLPSDNLCIPYYHHDGTPSSCFAQFSIGGIHGAEYNIEAYHYDLAEYDKKVYRFREVQRIYPDPIDLKKAKKVEIMEPDGTVKTYNASEFLQNGSTLTNAKYKSPGDPPELFQLRSGSYKLNGAYNWTSADLTNHEDFKSYYPNLLCMMMAFWNDGLGYDRYAEIFDQKESLGKKMKDKTISDDERAVAAVQREGTKLILNSASGAADASFESNIRMNNNIIKMRIIGQLFSYTIAQAQTYYGAKITSTNTDGLYSVMEAARNNAILAQESANIGVEIEPEPVYLISKDTNNRIELDHNTGKVLGASGGTLACQSWAGKKGPSPTKSLAHSAITDWALCEYMVFAATGDQVRASITKPFNPEVGLKILLSAHKKMDKVRILNMFQNVVASSPGSETFIFATTPDHPEQPIPLQHYNRVFIMRDNTPNTQHLYAATVRKLTPSQRSNRVKNNERPQQHDPTALYVLNAQGVETSSIEEGYEASVSKVTDIEPAWFMLIDNRDLHYIPEDELDYIIQNLDYGKYLYLLAKAFDGATLNADGKKGNSKGWRNKLPNCEPTTDVREFIFDIDTAAAKLGLALPGNVNAAQLAEQEALKLAAQETENAQEEASEAPTDDGSETNTEIAWPDKPFGDVPDVPDPMPAQPQSVEPPETQEPVEQPAETPVTAEPDDVPEPIETPAPAETQEQPEPLPESEPQQQPEPAPQPGPMPEPMSAPVPAPAPSLNDMIQAKNDADAQAIQAQLRQNLNECVQLVNNLRDIPTKLISPQYLATIQTALQTTLEKL